MYDLYNSNLAALQSAIGVTVNHKHKLPMVAKAKDGGYDLTQREFTLWFTGVTKKVEAFEAALGHETVA